MSEKLIRLYWSHIANADFDSLNGLMSDAAYVWLPNTKEVFKGTAKYIEFYKQYPDSWNVDLTKLYVCEETVITVAKKTNTQNTKSFYVTSFFKLKDNLIEEITEYWGDNGDPPKWRLDKNLSERY